MSQMPARAVQGSWMMRAYRSEDTSSSRSRLSHPQATDPIRSRRWGRSWAAMAIGRAAIGAAMGAGCKQSAPSAEAPVTIAAAADLAVAFREVGEAYATTGHAKP